MLKKRRFYVAAALFLLFFSYLFYQNNSIDISYVHLICPGVKNPIRIVHLSDLHGKEFGKNNQVLLSKTASLNPDLICFTGDLFSRDQIVRKKYLIKADNFCKLSLLAPVYFIPGNHEEWADSLASPLYAFLNNHKINVLKNSFTKTNVNGNEILIAGIAELSIGEAEALKYVETLPSDVSIKLLLSHYPQYFDLYEKKGRTLMLSGHVHGGQIIIPFAGGIFGPGQGVFPKYYDGLYKKNDSSLIVSRGLGNSLFPFRINNRPQITLITLSGSI